MGALIQHFIVLEIILFFLRVVCGAFKQKQNQIKNHEYPVSQVLLKLNSVLKFAPSYPLTGPTRDRPPAYSAGLGPPAGREGRLQFSLVTPHMPGRWAIAGAPPRNQMCVLTQGGVRAGWPPPSHRPGKSDICPRHIVLGQP